MMRNFADQALGAGKPFTSVSVWIDRLSSTSYAEDDYDGIPELVEAINIQSTGPTEASRQIRKKLKYGTVHGQKRAITMLNALVENCGPRFQSTFADAQLVERIKLMSQDPLVDASVRKKLMRVLLSWQNHFKNEPSMRLVAGLYAACGGGRKSDAQLKGDAAESFRKKKDADDRERQLRMDKKASERMQKEEDLKRAKEKKKGGAKRPTFDFEKEKPAIMSTLATSQQAATALVNALQHVNREKESVTVNERVQMYLGRVKVERKKVVRYIQLVRDEEYLGGLISTNDQIILSLELYDKLSKAADADSDEEGNEPLANISGSKSAAEKAHDRAEAEEAEIRFVQKRLAAAHLDEGQLESLQDKQRIQIERHNSYRSQNTRSGQNEHSRAGDGHLKDLMDLNFDDHQHSNSSRNTSYAAPSSSSRPSNQGGASLSDYSDYESEDSDEEVAAAKSQGQKGSERWSNGADDDDANAWAPIANHQPRIGPDSLLHDYDDDGGGDIDDDDDPFADPQDRLENFAPLRASGARLDYTAV
ncbi:hypothetical protein CBS101457_006666 [Exobasidium rhododendri]|nr:hypothetical protein CBS101457_006666 [Exobasidium rhododendri]